MLLGEFEGKIGDKQRVALPKQFRSILGDKIIITKGFERSLIIVSEKNYSALLEGTEGKPFITKEIRETQRYLLGGASYIKLDSKGRIIVPEYLRNHAGLTYDVVFLGIQRYVEVWDKETWKKHSQKLTQTIETVAQRLSGERKDE